jgi:hypothetical protein
MARVVRVRTTRARNHDEACFAFARFLFKVERADGGGGVTAPFTNSTRPPLAPGKFL